MSKPDLVCVDPKDAHQVWPHVEHLLLSATKKCGSWSITSIMDEVMCGDQLLWITWGGKRIQAAATTKLIRELQGLVCLVVACGGSDEDWCERFSPIEEFARAEGCIRVRIQGRPGWARIFKEYKTEWITLEKKLD